MSNNDSVQDSAVADAEDKLMGVSGTENVPSSSSRILRSKKKQRPTVEIEYEMETEATDAVRQK